MRVLTVGVFDCLHVGHVNLLEGAKAQGDYLIVGVQSDQGARASKGISPVSNLAGRMQVIDAIRYVDKTVAYDNVDELIASAEDLDVFAVGEDQSHAGFQRAMAYCRERGIKIITLSRTPDVSTTEIKAGQRGIGLPGAD